MNKHPRGTSSSFLVTASAGLLVILVGGAAAVGIDLLRNPNHTRFQGSTLPTLPTLAAFATVVSGGILWGGLLRQRREPSYRVFGMQLAAILPALTLLAGLAIVLSIRNL